MTPPAAPNPQTPSAPPRRSLGRVERRALAAAGKVLGLEAHHPLLGDLEEEMRLAKSAAGGLVHLTAELARCLAAELRSPTPRRRAGAGESAERAGSTAELAAELRHALRRARRSGVVVLLSVAVLAVAFGANLALWSLTKSVVLDPLDFERPEEIVAFWAPGDWALRELDLVRQRARGVSRIAAIHPWVEITLYGDEGAETLRVGEVVGEFFALFGVPPYRGRWLEPADGEPSMLSVVVVSHGFWRDRLGGRADVVGSVLRTASGPRTVVGVMPPGFEPPGGRVAAWTPASTAPGDDYDYNHSYRLYGRLASGVALPAAQTEARALATALGERFEYPPEFDKAAHGYFAGLRDEMVGDLRPPLLALGFGVAAVLLIALANVAAVQLSRVVSERRQLEVRSALGAGRRRLVRQVALDSLILGLVAALVGPVVALGLLELAPHLLPAETPRVQAIGLEPLVVVLGSLLLTLAAAGFGLAIGWRAAGRSGRHGPRRSLGDDASGSRARRGFVVAQTALAVALLVGATEVSRHLLDLLRADLGFDSDSVLSFRIELPRTPEEEATSDRLRRIVDGLQRLPGTSAVGAVQRLPLVDGWILNLFVEGESEDGALSTPTAHFRAVTPGYFETLRVAVVEGRGFEPGDDEQGPPVAILNQEAARRFFGGRDPLGHRVRSNLSDEFAVVVGVVENERLRGVRAPAPPVLYRPFAQVPASRSVGVVVRHEPGLAGALAESARGVVTAVDPRIPLAELEPLVERERRALRGLRAVSGLSVALTALAVGLSAFGLFGLLALRVATRRREIGLRMALGAPRASVARWALGDGLGAALAGALLGALLSWPLLVLAEAIVGALPSVRAESFLVPLGVLLASAAVASVAPLRRALAIDPGRVLGDE